MIWRVTILDVLLDGTLYIVDEAECPQKEAPEDSYTPGVWLPVLAVSCTSHNDRGHGINSALLTRYETRCPGEPESHHVFLPSHHGGLTHSSACSRGNAIM
jgi:hypothetical protein